MRIIAGRFGGRRLVAPKGRATRPTSDRVREAIFSALGELGGARVLDLYAGTGALGIEALSRGAERAVFVESARPALAALRENLGALGLGSDARVLATSVARAAGELAGEGPFDVVFLDPPYADLADATAALAALVGREGLLRGGADVVLEHASRDPAPTVPGLEQVASRVYGDTAVTRFVRPAT